MASWDEINKLAMEMWQRKEAQQNYLRAEIELKTALFGFFDDWGYREVYKYNTHVDCLWRKYNGNDISTEILYKVLEKSLKNYDYVKRNDFMVYFFTYLEKANRSYWSDLKNGKLDMLIEYEYDEADDNESDIGTGTSLPEPGPIPEEYLTDSHIIVQAAIMLSPISHYVNARSQKEEKVTKTQRQYFELFYTQDTVSVIKSLTNNDDIKKIKTGENELFKIFVDGFIKYLYEEECKTVDDLVDNVFRKIDNKSDETGEANCFIKYDKSKNGVDGIFIMQQEISKYLVVEDLIENFYADFQSVIGEFVKDTVKNNKYQIEIRVKDATISPHRKKYNKFMKTVMPEYGSYIFA